MSKDQTIIKLFFKLIGPSDCMCIKPETLMGGLLTTENNNVKFPVAERLIFVGDARPEAAGPPQRQPQQNLALLLVE